MRWWPQRLGGRIAVALLLAAGAVFALDVAVTRWERKPVPARRAGPAPASAARPATGRVSGDDIDFWPEQTPAPPAPSIGFRLLPVRGTVALCRRVASLPPDVAPVVEILADGSLVLRRPQPLARSPADPPPMSRDGIGAGIVLPTAELADLSPIARASLLGLLQQWFEERPVPPERVTAVDLALPAEALQRLLTWVP